MLVIMILSGRKINEMGYYQFKLDLELMGINTYENDNLVLKLYKLYLKEDKNDYRKAIGRFLKVPIGDRRE
jgi:hypothetical protein